jgi:hypothetical protein
MWCGFLQGLFLLFENSLQQFVKEPKQTNIATLSPLIKLCCLLAKAV